MAVNNPPKNAVLDDYDLQNNLKAIHPVWGDMCTRMAGEAWGLPLIDQKTKAFMVLVSDVASQGPAGPGTPFAAHVHMAIKQGATRQEIEEVLLFISVYCGFNKIPHFLACVDQIFAGQASGGNQ